MAQVYSERYDTGVKRFFAALVDGVVFLPVIFFVQWLGLKYSTDLQLLLSDAVYTFLAIGYPVVAHKLTGQTIGKWATGVCVIDVSESKYITWKQSILRESIYILFQILAYGYAVVLYIQRASFEGVFAKYTAVANAPVFAFLLIEFLTMLSNSRRRSLHDLIAKTIVVRL